MSWRSRSRPELAVLLRRDRLTGLGTLARVPLAGGTPREIAEQVLQADWSPDGATLAAIRGGNGTFRIESPIGRVRYETPHALRDIRVASDGRIAFIESYTGKNDVSILDPKSANRFRSRAAGATARPAWRGRRAGRRSGSPRPTPARHRRSTQ